MCNQTHLETVIVLGITSAKRTADVSLGKAPIRSLADINRVGVDGGIGTDLRGNCSCEKRDGECCHGRRGEHHGKSCGGEGPRIKQTNQLMFVGAV